MTGQSNDAAERSAHVERATARQANTCAVCGKAEPAHATRLAPGGLIHACSARCAEHPAYAGDPIVAMVQADMARRSAVGIGKYGTTLAREDLDLRAWLQHAYEETLDQAAYLKRAMVEMDKSKGGFWS